MTPATVHETGLCGGQAGLCGGKTRAGGGHPCRRPAGWGTDHVGTGRCKLHGGSSLAGPASPAWSHGKRSMYAKRLPARLQPDFEEAVAAGDPLLLVEELGVARALVVEALSSWEKGASGASIKQVREELAGLRTAIELEDKKEAWGAIRRAQEALSEAEAAVSAGDRTLKALDSVRKLAETSARVMDMRANSFTRVQSLALIARMVEVIAANVHDPQDRRRTLTALTVLTSEVAPAHMAPKG